MEPNFVLKCFFFDKIIIWVNVFGEKDPTHQFYYDVVWIIFNIMYKCIKKNICLSDQIFFTTPNLIIETSIYLKTNV